MRGPRRPNQPWKAADDAFLRENYLAKNNTELGAHLKRSENAVRQQLVRIGLIRPERTREEIAWCVRNNRFAEKPDVPKTVFRDPRAASIWHLVDLKRAGHSPRQTELTIPDEGTPTRFAVEVEYSPGSPAAMCEGM
jgi:hypothetical protein